MNEEKRGNDIAILKQEMAALKYEVAKLTMEALADSALLYSFIEALSEKDIKKAFYFYSHNASALMTNYIESLSGRDKEITDIRKISMLRSQHWISIFEKAMLENYGLTPPGNLD